MDPAFSTSLEVPVPHLAGIGGQATLSLHSHDGGKSFGFGMDDISPRPEGCFVIGIRPLSELVEATYVGHFPAGVGLSVEIGGVTIGHHSVYGGTLAQITAALQLVELVPIEASHWAK